MPNVYSFKDFEGSSHRILISLARRYCTRRGVLLDVGAAGGELGSEISPLFDRTIAIEGDAARIGDLHARFDDVVIGDLERIVRLPAGMSAVVLADILEHLSSPRSLLLRVHEALCDDGIVFVSVPNIANITTRLGLLFGLFIYRDRGILDATHVRFYTLSTIRKELSDAGFEVLAIHGSAIPVRLIVGEHVPEALLKPLEWSIARFTGLWKALLAYQIILVGRKKRSARPA